jgi:hypothetical protein
MTPEEHDRPTPTEIFKPAQTSKRPPPLLTEPPKRTQSGQHPVVTAMRAKLTSIVEGQAAVYDELDAKIDDATKKLKTPLPPNLPTVEIQEGEFDDEPTSH